jgi:hypothetical protein
MPKKGIVEVFYGGFAIAKVAGVVGGRSSYLLRQVELLERLGH